MEPPIAHASSVEDVELTDEDEEVDITDTDPANQTALPEDGSIVGKDVKLDPEMDLMKSSNLLKVSKFQNIIVFILDIHDYYYCLYEVIQNNCLNTGASSTNER